jgi:hypothetical protein
MALIISPAECPEILGELQVIDDILFLVIVLGIGLAILYVHGALRTRRARRMITDHSS